MPRRGDRRNRKRPVGNKKSHYKTKKARSRAEPGHVQTDSGPGRSGFHKRCGCRDPRTGKQLGARCRRLTRSDHGIWYFTAYVDGPDGRQRVRLRGGATAADVECEYAKFLGLPSYQALARSWTVARWLWFWLSDSTGRWRPSTQRAYESIIRNYLVPYLGRHRLSKLRMRHVQRAVDAVSRLRVNGDRLISAGTVNRIRAVLRSAFNEAMRQGLMGFNPARRIRVPDGARPTAVVWSREREQIWQETGIRPRVAVWEIAHLARFLEAVRGDRLFVLWWLVGLRGPRRGELAGVRWCDLDFGSAELYIREQVIVVGGQEHLGPPKSAAGVRVLALDEMTVRIFWEYWFAEKARRGGVAPDPKARMFTHDNGRLVSPDWLTRKFAKFVAALGLPPVRLHDLRHGAASLAGAAGNSLKQIQHDMGHASSVTTADTYWAVFNETAHRSVADTAELLLKHARIRMTLGGASQA